jgi:exonuclease VII large subunit
MGKVMTLPCKSGAYDCHTPQSQAHLLLPSVDEQFRLLKDQLQQKVNRRSQLKTDSERFTDWRVSLEYRNLGQEINALNQQMVELKRRFKQQTEESFDSMFVRAAQNTLHPDEFNRLRSYALQMLREFRESTHLGAPNERR